MKQTETLRLWSGAAARIWTRDLRRGRPDPAGS